MLISPFKLYAIDLAAILFYLSLQDWLSPLIGSENKKRRTYTWTIAGVCAFALVFSNLIGWLCFIGGTLIKAFKDRAREKTFFLYVLLFIDYILADDSSSDITLHLFHLQHTNTLVTYTWYVTGARILMLLSISLCFAWIIRLFLNNSLFKLFAANENIRFSIYVSVSICLLILSMNTVVKFYGIQIAYFSMTIAVFSVIVLIAALSLTVYLKTRKKEQDLRLAIEQKEIYDHYMSDLEENYNLLRAFKHDYQNMLLSLELYIEENDLSGLKDYFTQLKQNSDLELTAIPDYYNALAAVANTSVKSILLVKITKAKDSGIAVTLEVEKNFSLSAYEYEVVRMLGILLDNAIEASRGAEHPAIRLALLAEPGSLEIAIHNSYNPDCPIDMRRLVERGYSTKEQHTGMGLYTVRKIVDSHPDMLLELEKKSFFMVTVTLLTESR